MAHEWWNDPNDDGGRRWRWRCRLCHRTYVNQSRTEAPQAWVRVPGSVPGVGVVFWIALLPLLLHRVLVHEPQLPPRLLPTVAIFIAPPAVIMLSWQSLTGRVDDAFGRATYATAVFFLVLLLAQARPLLRLPFAPPFLAYTFPLAAAAAAAVAMAGASPSLAADIVAVAVLALATAVVAVVLSLTIRSAVRGELLVPEG